MRVRHVWVAILLAFSSVLFAQDQEPQPSASEVKELSWKEICKVYEVPEWYEDARFGIWVHWGGQTFPAQGGGWYARRMYEPNQFRYSKSFNDIDQREEFGRWAYGFHLKHYGHPSEFGYKDILNLWKAEKLDTDSIVEYAKSIGAKYFVALANHHDRFDNFDSTYQPWNSVNVGPKKDIIREFEQSAKKYGMKFGVSSHDDRFLDWWKCAFGSDNYGPKKGVPYDGRMTKADGKGKWWEGLDPADLYGVPPEQRTPEYHKTVKENFLKRHVELVTKYDVDYVFFDGKGLPYGSVGTEFCRQYFNRSLKKHGRIDTVVTSKCGNKMGPIVLDFEGNSAVNVRAQTWQAIRAYSGWFWKENNTLGMDAGDIIETLVDCCSKNGNLLLNIELLPDGRLNPKHKPMLDEVGKWIRVNAAAVYGSRPWKVYGDNLHSTFIKTGEAEYAVNPEGGIEGEKQIKSSGGDEVNRKKRTICKRNIESEPYEPDEVRFATKGDRFFIYVMNPAPGPINIPALGLQSPQEPGTIRSICMIGSDQEIGFNQTKDALALTVPEKRPSKYASVFEVQL